MKYYTCKSLRDAVNLICSFKWNYNWVKQSHNFNKQGREVSVLFIFFSVILLSFFGIPCHYHETRNIPQIQNRSEIWSTNRSSYKSWCHSNPLSLQRYFRCIWVTRWVFNKMYDLLNFRDNLGSPPVFERIRIAHHFSFLHSVVCFACHCSVSCVPILSVSLDCAFLITPRFVFSSVYSTFKNH